MVPFIILLIYSLAPPFFLFSSLLTFKRDCTSRFQGHIQLMHVPFIILVQLLAVVSQ